MSWVIEEITTSTIGFVIAMVVLSVIIGVGLYGYWVYVNHITLENYLWPIAEVLPYKGEYFLAIVNTGNEPFYVKQIYLKGGTVLTPNQAVNPSLNWCSTSNIKLMHNQWWCGEANQLPVAVRVCSAIDPRVCTVVPVHGWSTVDVYSLLGTNCPVLVTVSDPYSATWWVIWFMQSGFYSKSGSTTYTWCIDPPYHPITISFNAFAFSNSFGYICQISPTSTNVEYNGKPVTQVFTVTCDPLPLLTPSNYFVYVSVTNDTLGAIWQISSSVDSIFGIGDVNNQQLPIGGQTDTLTASIIFNPIGYTCSISPGSTQATNGSSYTFTVNCVYSPYPPCPVSPPIVSTNPSIGPPQPTSSASVSSIPYGQSEQVTFYYNAQESGNNYIFQYWVIGGQTYYQTNPSITETLACTTRGGTLTGPSGTAYYQYQPPGGVVIHPDTIDLTQSSETYTFTWTSAWSGTGTLTWNISGLVFIYYNSTPAGLVVWSANVTLPNGIIAAQGSGFLKITNYPQPSNPLSFYVCVVGGYGTVNDVDVNQGSAKGTVYIACELY